MASQNKGNSFDLALSIVRNSHLKYPDKAILDSFLTDAVDVELASQYFLQRCYEKSHHIATLDKFVAEWKVVVTKFSHCLVDSQPQSFEKSAVSEVTTRDGNRCCITRSMGAPQDKLVVAPILSLYKFVVGGGKEHMVGFLNAYLTPQIAQWLISRPSQGLSFGQCHWLVLESAQRAFRNCYVGIHEERGMRLLTEVLVGGVPSLRLHNIPKSSRGFDNKPESNVDHPHPNLLLLQLHFAPAVRWLSVAHEMTKFPQSLSLPLPKARGLSARCGILHRLARGALATWLFFPCVVRFYVYDKLRLLGRTWYGKTGHNRQRLPFGMHLKFRKGQEGYDNELGALNLVRQHTSITVPYPMDIVRSTSTKEFFFLTSAIPGEPVAYHIDHFSDSDQAAFIHDLRKYVAELRAVPREDGMNPGFSITNAVGGPIRDHRMDLNPAGPYTDEAAFNDHMKLGVVPGVVHRTGHRIVFTHGVFHMSNILVDPLTRRLTGIVNWGYSGWYPDYWEYTKSYRYTILNWRWRMIMDAVFDGKELFKSELETETALWSAVE